MTSMEDLVNRRTNLDISQGELALVIGMHASALSKLESGQADPRESTINKIKTGIDVIEKNKKARKAGIIVLDILDLKNTLYNAMIGDLEQLEAELNTATTPGELAHTLVNKICDSVCD